MNNLYFFPKLTDELIENCGCECSKYNFSYKYQDKTYGLKQKGVSTLKLSDPLEIWKVETEGLSFSKEVRIAYPQLLKGKGGIACTKAEIGICIIWTNKTLTQTGYILPDAGNDVTTATGRICRFKHTFEPGEIKGDLELSLIMYIKKKASSVLPDEVDLINEEGVSIGEIETIVLDFNSIYMDFPIEECKSDTQPLWWIEFSQWEDPKVDLFTKENICLYLNPKYDACPMAGENIKNKDLLIEIISTAYFLIFQRLSDDELSATKNNIGLNPNSICSIMHQFLLGCDDLHWESPEKFRKSLQLNIASILEEGDD